MVHFYIGDPSKIVVDFHQGPEPVKVKQEPKLIFSDNLTEEQKVKKETILNLQKQVVEKRQMIASQVADLQLECKSDKVNNLIQALLNAQ